MKIEKDGSVSNPTVEEMACIGLRNKLIENEEEFESLLKLGIFEGSIFGDVIEQIEENKTQEEKE